VAIKRMRAHSSSWLRIERSQLWLALRLVSYAVDDSALGMRND